MICLAKSHFSVMIYFSSFSSFATINSPLVKPCFLYQNKPLRGAWGGRGRKFKSCHSDQKRGRVQFDGLPRFSLFISQNLLKSRVFATNTIGLFFPSFGVEQARFLPLTTCLTTYGDFWLIFEQFLIVLWR